MPHPVSVTFLRRLATTDPGRDPTKLQGVVVENSLDVTRVVMEYLTKKLPNVVVAMPK